MVLKEAFMGFMRCNNYNRAGARNRTKRSTVLARSGVPKLKSLLYLMALNSKKLMLILQEPQKLLHSYDI